MTTQRQAIETRYMGVTFRSRLEAEWALNLNMWGIAWSYEPGGFTLPSGRNYLPDFWLPEIRTWLEVKGPGVDGLDKAKEFASVDISADDTGWLRRDENFVIGHAPIGDRVSFEVTCRWCSRFVNNLWMRPKSQAFLASCYRGHPGFCTEHAGDEAGSCGMDSRCWVPGCGEKVPWRHINDEPFHRLRWTRTGKA